MVSFHPVQTRGSFLNYDSQYCMVETPIHSASADGTLRRLGALVPACPGDFVMEQEHGDSLPW